MEDDEILTSEFQFIEVKANMDSLIVKLPMLYTTMKVQQAINIKPYIIDLGNHDGEVKIEWSCRLNNKNFCENKNDDFLNIESGFLEEGEYNISIRVNKGAMKKTDTCKIKIMNDVPSIEIDTLEYPILPSSGVHIRANIDDLRTFCTLQWKSTDSYFLLDLNQIPGNVNELRLVIVKRDLFLKELEEFSNDVSNKEHDLLIPPPTENWAGLPAEDKNYKLHFTLEAKCPKVQLQDDVDIEYSGSILNDTIMVSALVEIDVNVPPKIQPLTVEPSTGVALETVFTFQTLKAVETGTRCPFLYKFGYLLGDRENVFCNMLEYTKCETVLPHTDKGIKTFLKVCDSFNSCAKLFGPVVNILLPDQINETKVLKIYKEKMNSEDFQKAFGYALTILYTSNALQEEDKYTEYFSREVSNKIQYLIKHYNAEANWAKRANKLIKYISDFNKELSFSDKVINGLVELRTKLLSYHKENLTVPRRKLLATEKLLTDLENFKSYLEVSDIIITSSKDKNRVASEKEHLRRIIKQYMGKLCTELYQTRERVSLVFKSVILVVEELPKKSYGNFHTIPYKENPWNTSAVIKLNLEDMMKMRNEKLCIAKIAYKNILNKTGIIYEADILNAIDGNMVLEDIKNTMLIPFDTGEVENKVPKCLVYRNEWQTKCEFIKNISQYAQCFCSIMGSYYLEYEDKKVSVTELQSNTTNFPSTRAQLGDDYTENEKLTVKTTPLTYKQNTIQFVTTTKSVQNVNNVPYSTIESRLFEDTNSEDITDISKFSTSPITEIVEATTILPDFDNGGPTATSNSNAEKTSSSYVEDNTADIASYVLIASSLLGMGVLYYILRKLSITSVRVDTDDVETHKYAKLHDEFLLN
ncbi:uncharacterized protein LOC108905358 [Anoplophora glabripennis]|uniref:uncharacterized protein LOC108905358 n=1 Tax=Anoplophora glabripennis TaxID=217634 RepID=UPI000C76A56D|nr:uncharacterized protein LOC108905358 [Anoplophora glabripennis]